MKIKRHSKGAKYRIREIRTGHALNLLGTKEI
jgi:hypothetical protein